MEIRALYDYTMGALKVEQLNEGIIKLDGTYAVSYNHLRAHEPEAEIVCLLLL